MLHKKFLFIGELQPNSIHGISVSNALNLKFLAEKFEIDIIEERVSLREHAKSSFNKVFSVFGDIVDIIKISFSKKFDYFYLVLSLSTQGVIKTFLTVFLFKFFNKSSIILHIHRGDFLVFYKKPFNKFLTNLIFKRISKIIVLSESQRDILCNISKKEIVVLENSISVEYEFNDKKIENRKFLYISNYILEKGILDLLNSFKKLSDINPDIILECFGEFSDKKLEEQILTFVSKQIKINKTILDEEKFKKIHEADCLILPSWNEGQPVILLEAMSLGTPIIASDVGLIKELLGDNYKYLIKPIDENDLYVKMQNFIQDKNKIELSNSLKDRYYKFYNHKKHKEKLFKIFT